MRDGQVYAHMYMYSFVEVEEVTCIGFYMHSCISVSSLLACLIDNDYVVDM
jgi:hypothetical protein